MSKCIVRVFTFFFSFLATWKYLKRWNVTHPEHEALKGLGTWEGQGSRALHPQLSSAGAHGEAEHPPAPEELSFKMFLCVQGAFPPARENSSKKAPASEVRHRPHLAESSAGSPPEKCCLLHRPEGPVCGSSAYLKILSSHFFQFCVFHKFSSFSWWIVLAVWFLEVGIYCFVPHKMEAGILWMAQPGWANFSRLTRNYYYYYYFKEQFCGSVVMLLP